MHSIPVWTAEDTSTGPSTNIWHDCPWRDLRDGQTPGVLGIAEHFDFRKLKHSSNINAAEAYWDQGYKVFGSDGAAIAIVDALGGGATFSSDGDNEGASIAQNCPPFQISQSHGKLWFECRIKTSTITDTKHGWFLGLADSTALTATVPIAAAGTLADLNFVGFHRLEGDGDQIDTVYKANGVTQVTVDTDALDGASVWGGTIDSALVADTYIKLGMKWEPRGDRHGDFRVIFYANGLRLTETCDVISAAGTDFPNDVRLGMCFALLNATATTPGNTTIHWWRAAQLHLS